MNAGLPTDECHRIERECERLVLLYARYADSFQDDAFAALFAEDALLHRGDHPLRGREAIRAAMRQRRRDAVVRHLCFNILIDVIDRDQATGTSYLTLYRHFGAATIPTPMIEPEMIAEYHDRFVSTSTGWRIAERRAVVVFKHPSSTH
ncbi:MAG: nuclear transport factor 2 family protein [Burkholderiales bacterium]